MALCNDVRSSAFGSVFTSSCVNDACSRFKCILQQSIDKHAPLITKKIKGGLCPWMSSEVKSEMNLRDDYSERLVGQIVRLTGQLTNDNATKGIAK